MFSLFKDVKTIDGRHYETFIEAAKAAGYVKIINTCIHDESSKSNNFIIEFNQCQTS